MNFVKRVFGLPRRLKQFEKPRHLLLAAAVFAAYVVVVVRTAWMSDDAFITFRTIDNFVHGMGLTWNVPVRVQAYTHPLWMFFLSTFYFFTREPFYTAIIASLVLNIIAIGILLFGGKERGRAIVVPLLILTFSVAFIDFSTSGLEQPMTCLLFSLFVVVFYRNERTERTFLYAGLIAAAAFLNRADLLLLYFPPVVFGLIKQRNLKTASRFLLGLSPVFVWEAFSIIYYGFFVPNTAFVKLCHGLPRSMMLEQGGRYLVNSLSRDPLTLISIAAGLLTVFSCRCRRYAPLALGVVLYLYYLVYIGGDFMSGRFLVTPLFVAVFFISQFLRGSRVRYRIAASVCAVVLGFSAPYPTVLSDSTYGDDRKINGEIIAAYGIADERAYWFHCAGMLSAKRDVNSPICFHRAPFEPPRFKGEKFINAGGPGYLGYYLGPEWNVFDGLGIAEPLLARLRSPYAIGWRPGHFPKKVPVGYLETVKTGVNSIEDKNVKKYHKALQTIITGDLFSVARLKEIWKMNTGGYDDLLPRYDLKPPVEVVVPISAFSLPKYAEKSECKDVSLWYYQYPKLFSTGGVSHHRGIEFGANDEASYLIEVQSKGEIVERHHVPDFSKRRGYIRKYCISLSAQAAKDGFDRIRFQPSVGYNACFSYIRLVDSCGQTNGSKKTPRYLSR